MTSPASENNRRFQSVLRLALAAFIGLGTHGAAEASTDWMDGTSQWGVGFVDDGAQSYCTLMWNSETGRTVEFRQGLKSASWHLSDAGWNFADNAQPKIMLVGQGRMLTIGAVSDGKTSLAVTDHAGIVRAIIQNSIAGTVDLDFAVGDSGEQWEIPTSRIYSMHAGVTKCLRKLSAQAAAQKLPQNKDPSDGF